MEEVTYDQLKENLDKYRIIDVREPDEYEKGHLPQAKNIPLGAFIRDLENATECDKDIILYCASGGRCGIAASICEKKGKENILVYKGGYKEWEQKE